ncbi:MAG TPA: BCCT family transporter, partial [Staphylococcus kloosii]
WGVILALFAIIMIYTGGTQSIQNLLIIAALPFSLVIIFMMWALFKSLALEKPRHTNNKLYVGDEKLLHYRKVNQEDIEENSDQQHTTK